MNDINDLRSELFETMRALRDKANPLDVNRAQAVAAVAGRIIDSVKAETDYVRTFGGRAAVPASGFIVTGKRQDTLMHQVGNASEPAPGKGLPPSGPQGRV